MSRLRDERGTTVIEMTIVAALFFVILASVLAVLDSGTRTERATEARHQTMLEIREAMTQMTKDIRQALHVHPGSTSSHLIIDTIDGPTIEYEVVGEELVRVLEGGSSQIVLADHVSTIDPFCYDFDALADTCLATTAGDDVTMIRIILAAHPEVLSGGPITLATDVQLRNA